MHGHRVYSLSLILVSLANGLGASGQESSEVTPLPRAHAHNDYHHDRPLLDALDRGFCSFEADIFLVDGELLVGHHIADLREGRTLQGLYLDPLYDCVRKHGGTVYPNGPMITLLIDIKTNGVDVYRVLRKVLADYEDMLSGYHDGEYQDRAVQIVISGDRPRSEIEADSNRLVGIDGRLTDLDSNAPSHLMPMISDRWSSHFHWRGVGEIPSEERAKLRAIVEQAHADGRRVRFWATPEQPRLWQELLAAGVDHINTDKLDDLRGFLVTHATESNKDNH